MTATTIDRPAERPREAATKTMYAAVVHDFDEPLRMEEVAKPVPGPDEVVVRIEASGLCHTDIHAAHGDWPVKPTPPFTPGHEGVGIVEEIGPGVTEVVAGDRVAIPWLGYACGTCDYCVSGWETLCLEQKNMGYSLDGSFADYVKAYARYVVKVPFGVDPVDAAPLTCAGVTTYKAVKVGGTKPSDLVAVFGVGGLGHLAIQYAAIAGGRVVAVDLVEEKLDLARELGAEFTVNAAEQDPAAYIQMLGGADQAIALAVSPTSFAQAYRSLRRGGTLVFVALPAENHVDLPIFETVLNGITVVGSIVGTRVDLREVFELHAAGKTRVIRETRSLGEVNEAMADVEAGRVPARIVFTPDPDEAATI
ncbi:MAG TPA: zinc-dependent alcohol dehydrogenase [Gaiellaceae bacterium]|nr:zinc-dependent alcohol dehydrogenase [Gaiellaceae bacterium]